MQWKDMGTPMERANFRIASGLLSYLVGSGVIEKQSAIESLERYIEKAADEEEATLYRAILEGWKSDSPTAFEVIKGGKDE